MGSGITDADGYPVPVTVTAGEPAQAVVAERGAGQGLRVGLRLSPPAGELVWSCTPAAARELAAVLLQAAEETENAPGSVPSRWRRANCAAATSATATGP